MQLDNLKVKEIRVRLDKITRKCQKIHSKRKYGKDPLVSAIQEYIIEIADIITDECPNFDKKTKMCKIFNESCEIILKKECAYSKENPFIEEEEHE